MMMRTGLAAIAVAVVVAAPPTRKRIKLKSRQSVNLLSESAMQARKPIRPEEANAVKYPVAVVSGTSSLSTVESEAQARRISFIISAVWTFVKYFLEKWWESHTTLIDPMSGKINGKAVEFFEKVVDFVNKKLPLSWFSSDGEKKARKEKEKEIVNEDNICERDILSRLPDWKDNAKKVWLDNLKSIVGYDIYEAVKTEATELTKKFSDDDFKESKGFCGSHCDSKAEDKCQKFVSHQVETAFKKWWVEKGVNDHRDSKMETHNALGQIRNTITILWKVIQPILVVMDTLDVKVAKIFPALTVSKIVENLKQMLKVACVFSVVGGVISYLDSHKKLKDFIMTILEKLASFL